MNSSANDATALAKSVRFSPGVMHVDLCDGRTISVPLKWYPRLHAAKAIERKNWRLIAKGSNIHRSGIDEDISVAGLLAGRRSGESAASLKKWSAGRRSSQPKGDSLRKARVNGKN